MFLNKSIRYRKVAISVFALILSTTVPHLEIAKNAGAAERFQSFATRPVIRQASLDASVNACATGSFDETKVVQANLKEPTAPPSFSPELTYRLPFTFPQGTDAESASTVELLCSNDRGKTWYSYASVNSGEHKTAFLFRAPQSGEYWFALKTSFKNGKCAFSSTKAYQFGVEEELTLENVAMDDFALDTDEPTVSSPQATSAESDDISNLSEDVEETAPSALTLSANDHSDDLAMIDNASYMNDSDNSQDKNDFALNDDSNESESATEQKEAPKPRPGKIKSLSFAKEEGTERLMVLVRWFRPEELKAEDRGTFSMLNVQRGPSSKGPWTVVGEDLSVKESGYGWIATEDEMKPFYIRIVVFDKEGNKWTDISPSALDVTAKGIRSALGTVKTPIPFPPSSEEEVSTSPSEEKSDSDDSASLIPNTASEDQSEEPSEKNSEEKKDESALTEQERQEQLARDVEEARQESKKFTVRSTAPDEPKKKEYLTNTVRRERPIIPAPTNPNEFEVNPLFTQGFGVLARAAQTRYASYDGHDGNRSIFTKPTTTRGEATRPAERIVDPIKENARIAAQRQEEARKRQEELAKYQKEHEMDIFEKKPELMEGRMFYLDQNGNLTTTPTQEFQQALGYTGNFDGNFTTTNGQVINGQIVNGQIVQNGTVNGDGTNGIYMPRETESYDASVRSGAATMMNNAYPNASSSGSSPLNNRYADPVMSTDVNGATQLPVNVGTMNNGGQSINNGAVPMSAAPMQTVPTQTTNGTNASMQEIPQTSYSTEYLNPYADNYGVSPQYEQTELPPRPSVSF